MLVGHKAPSICAIWRLHTGLCKFAQNISTNIWSLGKCRDLKLGEVPSLFITYNITISWLYPLNHGFRFIFSFWTVNTTYWTMRDVYRWLTAVDYRKVSKVKAFREPSTILSIVAIRSWVKFLETSTSAEAFLWIFHVQFWQKTLPGYRKGSVCLGRQLIWLKLCGLVFT